MGLAEFSLPGGAGGYGAHGLVGIDQSLDRTVERVHSGAGVGHVVALARRVHDGVCDLEKMFTVNRIHHFQQHADTLLRRGLCPRANGAPGRGKDAVDLWMRILGAQRFLGVGRDLFRCQRALRRSFGIFVIVHLKALPAMLFKCGAAGGVGRFMIRVERWGLGKRAPAMALAARGLGLFEQCAVALHRIDVVRFHAISLDC